MGYYPAARPSARWTELLLSVNTKQRLLALLMLAVLWGILLGPRQRRFGSIKGLSHDLPRRQARPRAWPVASSSSASCLVFASSSLTALGFRGVGVELGRECLVFRRAPARRSRRPKQWRSKSASVECRRGGAKGGVAKSHVHWCVECVECVECVGCCILPRRPGSVRRGSAGHCAREGKVRGRFRGTARIAEET